MITRKGLATISALFGRTIGKAIPKENLEGWEVVLSPLPDDLAVQAAMDVLRTKTDTFDIPPGAVYQAAMKILDQKQPSEGDAWRMVRERLAGNLDREDLPVAVARAAEQVGWQALREITVNDSWTRRDFLSFYRETIRRTAEQRLAEFIAIGPGRDQERLPEPTDERSLPPPSDDDGEGPYVPVTDLRKAIADMNKEVK